MPTAPTPPPGSNDAKIATTAFVMEAIEHHIAGVSSFNGRTGHVFLDLVDIVYAGGAPNHSPHLTGEPEADTPPLGDDTRRIATTEFVQRAIDIVRADSVYSFNTRRGHVILTLGDITAVGGAPIEDTQLIGFARAPTPPEWDRSTRIATTEYVRIDVDREIDNLRNELNDELGDDIEELRNNTVWSWNQRKGHVTMRPSDLSAVGGAFLHSPNFTGEPRAPTAPPHTDDNQIATTRYVDAAIRSNPGPPGQQGPVGPPGQGLAFKGHISNVMELPEHGNLIGDWYLVNGNGWSWDGERWLAMGPMRGPPGTADAHVGPTPPHEPTEGALWFSPQDRTLYVWEDSGWRRSDRVYEGGEPGLVPEGLGPITNPVVFLRGDGWSYLPVVDYYTPGITPLPSVTVPPDEMRGRFLRSDGEWSRELFNRTFDLYSNSNYNYLVRLLTEPESGYSGVQIYGHYPLIAGIPIGLDDNQWRIELGSPENGLFKIAYRNNNTGSQTDIIRISQYSGNVDIKGTEFFPGGTSRFLRSDGSWSSPGSVVETFYESENANISPGSSLVLWSGQSGAVNITLPSLSSAPVGFEITILMLIYSGPVSFTVRGQPNEYLYNTWEGAQQYADLISLTRSVLTCLVIGRGQGSWFVKYVSSSTPP
jgi:hypothetical protein